MNSQRWARLMQRLGYGANADTFRALAAAYAEPHRHYHTAEHISTCLKLLDASIALAGRPDEIELALWFHDAIYKPLSAGNERNSADWAAKFLKANAAPPEVIARVRGLVMATLHDAPPQTRDESLLLDLDLSILGADAETYAKYEAAIRKEYRMVPMLIYRGKRAEVLKGFLQRPRIYHLPPFQAGREAQARTNLAHAIARFSGHPEEQG